VKARHATALALVGWYLMIPPKVWNVSDGRATLNMWQIGASYDSSKACEKAVLRPIPIAKSFATLYGTYAQCVASDDPRLKPN
jgi:hypothetical protein